MFYLLPLSLQHLEYNILLTRNMKISITQHIVTTYHIAIFEPATHPAIDEIASGFQETLHHHGTNYSFDRYNANGNKTLLRAQAEEIIYGDYDLVFTIGAACTQTMYELTNKKQKQLPIVFSAVDIPVKTGLITSLESSGNNLTGVIEGDKQIIYEQALAALLQIKPNTKNILLVYDPHHGTGLDEDRMILNSILKKHNVNLHVAVINHANEIQQKVQLLLDGNDVVLILADNTVVSGIDSLITLCNRYGITLFASDLNSGDKGAALSFGITQYEFGSKAAKTARQILRKNKQPTDIPTIIIGKMKLKINTSTMFKQGLDLSPAVLNHVQKNGGIVL